MLEKIPRETHLIAIDFYGKRISGITRKEENLSAKVVDYYKKQVVPRYGIKYVLNFK
jgi:hypothetical protein